MSLNRSKASFFRIEKERKKHCKVYEQMRYFRIGVSLGFFTY